MSAQYRMVLENLLDALERQHNTCLGCGRDLPYSPRVKTWINAAKELRAQQPPKAENVRTPI